MKIFRERVILLTMLIFVFSGRIIAEEIAAFSTDYSSAAVAAFVDMQNAIKNEEYENAWGMLAGFHKQLRYNGDIEEFKKEFSDQQRRDEFSNLKIEGVKSLTNTEAELLMSSPSSQPPSKFYMVQEDWIWKFGGRIGGVPEGGPRKRKGGPGRREGADENSNETIEN